MDARDASAVFLAFEECIERYTQERRRRVEAFVQDHFSLRKTLQLQKRSLLRDFLAYPLNAIWSIPYLSFKKGIESLDKIGVSGLTPLLTKIPSGIKTDYQREIERRIETDLLEWSCTKRGENRNAFLAELQSHPLLANLLASGALSHPTFLTDDDLKQLIEQYSATRAVASDLASSAGTLLLGWLLFKDHSLTITAIGERIARQRAQARAASHFFLGETLGTTWYQLVPPQPQTGDLIIGTVIVGILVMVFCLIVSALSDPFRKVLGLQQKKLHALIDHLEERLHLQVNKTVKQVLQQESFVRRTAASGESSLHEIGGAPEQLR